MMDGSVPDVVGLADGVLADGGYSLSQVDVDHVMQFFWMIVMVDLFQLVATLVLLGVVLGAVLTRKWSM